MIETNGVPLAKTRVLYNCFDPCLERRVIGDKASLKLEHPNLLTVSRISKEDRYKGHALILQALTQVHCEIPDIHYYIVGTGDLVPELEQMVAEFKLEPNVHFLGFLADDELISAYEQCDLFVMPSSAEGFGYVFAEAMAYGKAVVAGNRDATVEVVRDRETGLLVDPFQHEELAKAITLLLTDRELRERMGRRGAQVVDEEFGFEKFRQTLIGYLSEALGRKREAMPFGSLAARGQQ
jgi:phosphatidylinositol alpha-1,6-mannosyltransferase